MKTMKFKILSVLMILAVSVGLNAAETKAKTSTNKKPVAAKTKSTKKPEVKPEVKAEVKSESDEVIEVDTTNDKPESEAKSIEKKDSSAVPAASNSVLEFYNEITKKCSEGRANFSQELVKLDDRIKNQSRSLDKAKTEALFKEENLSSEIFSYFATDLISDDSDLRGFKACGDHYANFVKAIKEKDTNKANEQFGFWESCLQSDYKESIPDIAQKVIACQNKSRSPNQIRK